MNSLISALNHQTETKTSITATLGFDGFVDTIIRLVHHHAPDGSNVYFDSMKGWGEYITDKVGKNFTIELTNQTTKLGGNMPIMANALANLGISVNCVGAMGYPQVHPAFEQMASGCKLLSFSAPGLTQALEFRDGKIMLGNVDDLNQTDWPTLKERLSENALIEAYENSTLIGMLNWGELTKSTAFWQGLLTEVFPKCNFKTQPILFFDSSDCSKRTHVEIKQMLSLVKQFSAFGKTIMGVNQNEAHFLHELIEGISAQHKDLVKVGADIIERLGVTVLLLHNRNEAAVVTREHQVRMPSYFVEHPKLLTGAGDNFNAGFCYGYLLNLDLTDCLTAAHAVSNYYIRNGASPSLKNIIDSLPLLTK